MQNHAKSPKKPTKNILSKTGRNSVFAQNILAATSGPPAGDVHGWLCAWAYEQGTSQRQHDRPR